MILPLRKKSKDPKSKAGEQAFDLNDLKKVKDGEAMTLTRKGLCKLKKGEKTCCSNDHTKAFKKLTKGYILKKLDFQPNPFKIIRAIGKEIKKSKCLSDKDSKQKIDDIIKDKGIKKVFSSMRTCQKKAIFGQGSLLRGTICQVCMDPSKFSTYFKGDGEDLQLRVHPNTMKAYGDAMDASFVCAEGQDKIFRTAVKKLVENLGSGCKDVIASIKAKIDAQTQKKPNCKSNAKFFGDGCLKDIEDDGESDGFSGSDGEKDEKDGEDKPKKRFRRYRRVLEENESSYIEDSSNGVDNAYEADEEEEKELDSIAGEGYEDPDAGGSGSSGSSGSSGGSTDSSGSILAMSVGLLCIIAAAFI